MEMDILKEKENHLLKRKELEIEIKHEKATPSKTDIVKELSTRYSVPEENIVLDYVETGKGTRSAFAKAKLYKEKPKIKVKKSKEVAKPSRS